jgi:hypothetical protein
MIRRWGRISCGRCCAGLPGQNQNKSMPVPFEIISARSKVIERHPADHDLAVNGASPRSRKANDGLRPNFMAVSGYDGICARSLKKTGGNDPFRKSRRRCECRRLGR